MDDLIDIARKKGFSELAERLSSCRSVFEYGDNAPINQNIGGTYAHEYLRLSTVLPSVTPFPTRRDAVPV